MVAAFTHDIFIKGCQVNFSIDGPEDVEVTTLYPEDSFRTVEECFGEYIVKIEEKQPTADSAIANTGPVVGMRQVTATCA